MAVHFLEEEAETTEAMVPAMVENNESGQGKRLPSFLLMKILRAKSKQK